MTAGHVVIRCVIFCFSDEHQNSVFVDVTCCYGDLQPDTVLMFPSSKRR